MLPTFPRVIELRRDANLVAMKIAVRQIAPQFAMIGHNIQFEGAAHTIRRADASEDQTDLAPLSAEVQVAMGTRLLDFTPQVVEAHLIAAARQMAEGMAKHFYEVMDRGTREAGMVVDGKGGPLTEDLLLEVVEKMEHTFNEDGSWNPPTMLVAPGMADALVAGGESPEAKRRLAEILERKRDEFRRRQAGRVLAG